MHVKWLPVTSVTKGCCNFGRPSECIMRAVELQSQEAAQYILQRIEGNKRNTPPVQTKGSHFHYSSQKWESIEEAARWLQDVHRISHSSPSQNVSSRHTFTSNRGMNIIREFFEHHHLHHGCHAYHYCLFHIVTTVTRFTEISLLQCLPLLLPYEDGPIKGVQRKSPCSFWSSWETDEYNIDKPGEGKDEVVPASN
jgi:hypothetical protein